MELAVHNNTNEKKRTPSGKGLTDICITANEDFLVPALSSQGIPGCMEVRQFSLTEIPKGQPLIHAYVTINLGNSETIVDVDADPLYDENSGEKISPTLHTISSLPRRTPDLQRSDQINRKL